MRFSPKIKLLFLGEKTVAVFDLRADQKPTQMVAATVATENVRIQGSRCILRGESGKN